jgi:protein transport protein SEC24
MNQLSVPIGLIISPTSSFAQEGDIPILNYGENNDVPRCKNEKCKAFINPYVKFVNDSENWECNLCKCINKTEDYYFKYIDNNGMSINKDTKIELNNGTYEYILNKSYWKNDRIPNTPIYYFLIDISYKAVQSGFSQCVLETIKDCINNNYFYNYEIFNIKICIITYDNSIHFYSVNPNASQFTMLSVNDQDIFIPTNKNNLLINLKENKNKIIQIIESIQNFLLNQNIEIKEATKTFDAIKSVNLLGGILGGKVLLFSGSNVNLLEEMNDPKDNEDDKNINQNLERGAKKLSQLGIKLTYNNFSVDVFQSCNEFIKLLSLNQLCDNSNGNIFFYKNFNPEIHYKNIYNQIKRVLTNEMQLEGTLKLRFSNGYYIKEYMTSVLLYNRRLFVFPCHDVDQKYSVLLSILTQEELEENELTNKFDDYIYIQSCLLFSQGDGTRRIRVHNLCLPVSSNNKDIFESIDVECLSAFYAQKLTHLIYRTRNLTNSVIQIENNFYSLINEYFNNSNSLKRELNSKMQLFILYFLGILKLNLFNRNNDKGYLNDIDLSNYFRLRLLRSNVEEIIVFIYPRIYILDECIELKKGEFPEIINDSIEFFNKGNLFLIDNGFYFILYFKKNIYNIICQDIFGVNSFDEINYFEVNESTIFDNDNNYGKYKMKISEIINGLRSTKSLFQDLYFVFEGINDENIFKELLIENNYNKTYPFDYNTFYDKIISGNYK